MSDGQTWTIIGGTLALVTFGFTWLQTSLKAEIRALDGRLGGRIDTLGAHLGGRIDTLTERVDGMNVRLTSLESRVERALQPKATTEG